MMCDCRHRPHHALQGVYPRLLPPLPCHQLTSGAGSPRLHPCLPHVQRRAAHTDSGEHDWLYKLPGSSAAVHVMLGVTHLPGSMHGVFPVMM